MKHKKYRSLSKDISNANIQQTVCETLKCDEPVRISITKVTAKNLLAYLKRCPEALERELSLVPSSHPTKLDHRLVLEAVKDESVKGE